MNWFMQVMRKYFVIEGRARRMEFWMFYLTVIIIGAGLWLVDLLLSAVGLDVLGTLFGIFITITSITVSIRRLHDIDRSGWWFLITFVPVLGTLIWLYFMFSDGTPGDNRYGPSPKYGPVN